LEKLKKGIKILLGEPEESFASTLMMMAASFDPVIITLAKNKRDLLKFAQKGEYDVVVVNTLLAPRKKAEIILKIREVNPHIPILATSAFKIRSQCLRAGANDFCLKSKMEKKFSKKLKDLLPNN
jgi:DNA-binding NarL/FixJ family response regulator